jgi:hypothetical protein
MWMLPFRETRVNTASVGEGKRRSAAREHAHEPGGLARYRASADMGGENVGFIEKQPQRPTAGDCYSDDIPAA